MKVSPWLNMAVVGACLALTISVWTAQWKLLRLAREPHHEFAGIGLMLLGLLELLLALGFGSIGFVINGLLMALAFVVAATGLSALLTGIQSAARSGDAN